MNTASPGPGHNAIAADRLRSIVERIERLNEERKVLGDDIKDILKEAKSAGLDTKVIRKVVQRRALERAEVAEQDALLDTYEHALGLL
jgi:uncharacterized protein (UPF0335 family)